jgi:multisubunit Na+/H+ antiporter MnhE subunit
MLARLVAFVALGFSFVWHVVTGGASTAWLIVRPGARPTSAVVPMDYQDLGDTGAVILACLISLTPGTTVIDIDTARRRMQLHLLDASQRDATVSRIEHVFARRLRTLFPEHHS